MRTVLGITLGFLFIVFAIPASAQGPDHLWSQRFGSTGLYYDVGSAVAVDGSGNVVVTGYFNDTVDFGGGPALVSAGSNDIFVAKYNASGVHQWSQGFGSTGLDQGNAIAADGSGNVVVAGSFSGTVTFGGVNLVSAGFADIFVAKYNASGVYQWSQRFGSTSSDAVNAVAVDGSGNVVATGYFAGTVNFGGGPLVGAGVSYDIFVAKYNASGAHLWSQRFGSTSNDHGYGVAVDGSGNVVVTGGFSGTVNFGGGNLVSAGLGDFFVAKYDASGVYLWSQRFGSTGGDYGSAVAVDGSVSEVVTGSFSGTVDFGGGNLVSAGGGDIFVAKYTSTTSKPFITSIADIGNDQGRKVRIRFSRSNYDAAGTVTVVTQYEAYRRNSALPSAMRESPAGPLSRKQLLDLGWVQAGEVSAHGAGTYLMDAPTDADSTIALGLYHSAFFIRAATAQPLIFFDSPVDSGYSLDNLAPGIPAAFAYNAGLLSWDESSAADFDYFSVYGSNTSSFGSATLVDYTIDTNMDVTASPHVFYFATGTDFSGNEGSPAVINTLSGVGGTPKSYVLSVSNYPNPFNPRTTVSYTVPSRASVTVAIYDARGLRVATLVNNESRAAGAYAIEWDGRADSGVTVSSGVYFARIDQNGASRSKKMVLLK